MGDGGVFLTPCTDLSRPVEELEYTCLLKITFTQASHDRGFKTCDRLPQLTLSVSFVEESVSGGRLLVECHVDPNISKATTVKEKDVVTCTESQSTSRVPKRTRFLTVQSVIRVKVQCDKKSLLTKTDPDYPDVGVHHVV
jgi:hypothetical protein